ncbi:MAG: type II and III secretion system protein family protein [Rhodobiaceae bacterium]|nr:type II and III secretion system protein family protein [Rhodobiaceae bacterium]
MFGIISAIAELARKEAGRSCFVAALMSGAVAILFASLPATTGHAADIGNRHIEILADQSLDTSPQIVRLGLNKSLVVDLPRAAKDVLVSSPKKADAVMRTPRRAYVIGMEVGQTNIFFFDDQGRQIVGLELVVEQDVSALHDMFARLIPGSNIRAEAINENVVLSGSAQSPADAARATDIAGRFAGDAKKVLNMIAVQGKDQIYLKVTVAEIQRNAAKQLGVDVDAAINQTAETAFRVISANPFSVAGQALSASGASATYQKGDTSITGVIRMMEENGVLRTLAEPTLTAISGESASFLAGGEFPIPVAADGGDITIEFKPFGVGLAFTPVVLSEGRISLRIKTEVSEITTDGAFGLNFGNANASLTIPGLKVRRAETTVELPSGGSLVMAGLLQESTKHNINGVPGAKDMPVLGALFRSRDFQNDETELVVIVTPYTVEPAARNKLALPTDNFKTPSDHTTNLMGRLNELYGVRGNAPAGDYSGRYGFIIK